MNKEKRRLISIFLVVIILSAAIATAIPFSMNYFEEQDKEEKALFAKAFVDVKEGVTPHSVNLTSIITDSEGKLEYFWDFGDGETSTEKSPSHTYIHTEIIETSDEETGKDSIKTSYTCTLTVKDESGRKTTDSIEIEVYGNRPPQISLQIPTSNPRRPSTPIEFSPKTIRIDSYQSEDYWMLHGKGLLPKSLTSKEGFFTISASASDPDGDEIVSYDWTLYPPSYTTRSGKPVDPEFHYTGQTVTIPTADMYPAKPYNLKLIVTDSAGQKSEENVPFTVQKSTSKSSIEVVRQKMSFIRKDIWIDKFAGELGPTVAQTLIAGIFYDKIIDKIDAPIVEALLTLFVMKSAINWVLIGPSELTNNLINSLKPILDKYENFEKIVNKSLIGVQNLIGKIDNKTKMDLSGTIESIEVLRETIGINNQRPIIKNPYPTQGSDYNLRNTEFVQIEVDDLHKDSDGKISKGENNSFTVTINGEYIDKDVYKYEDVKTSDGPFKAYFNTSSLPGNILPAIEEINWHVTVVDFQGDVVTENYKFTTVAL